LLLLSLYSLGVVAHHRGDSVRSAETGDVARDLTAATKDYEVHGG
jgi:hypothetical protein